MKMSTITLCAALFTSALVSLPAVAQDAKNLEQLLQMIQDSKISETQEYRQRQSEFNADKNRQAGPVSYTHLRAHET